MNAEKLKVFLKKGIPDHLLDEVAHLLERGCYSYLPTQTLIDAVNNANKTARESANQHLQNLQAKGLINQQKD